MRTDYIDQLIMHEVKQHGYVDDFRLSLKLGCSRILILNRLQNLISHKYVIDDNNAYTLTDAGTAEIEFFNYLENTQSLSKHPVFQWDVLYVPPKGWDTE